AGHQAGVETVRRVVKSAPEAGIGILTLFAFSSDNWRRPSEEVDGLMRMMAVYLDCETARCVEQGVRREVIGRRDRLAPSPGGAGVPRTGPEIRRGLNAAGPLARGMAGVKGAPAVLKRPPLPTAPRNRLQSGHAIVVAPAASLRPRRGGGAGGVRQ